MRRFSKSLPHPDSPGIIIARAVTGIGVVQAILINSRNSVEDAGTESAPWRGFAHHCESANDAANRLAKLRVASQTCANDTDQ